MAPGCTPARIDPGADRSGFGKCEQRFAFQAHVLENAPIGRPIALSHPGEMQNRRVLGSYRPFSSMRVSGVDHAWL
jgi:hypothetical protein